MRLNRQGLGYIAQMQAPQTSLQFTPFLAQALASTHPPIAHTHTARRMHPASPCDARCRLALLREPWWEQRHVKAVD
jgi:hypothetical protein